MDMQLRILQLMLEPSLRFHKLTKSKSQHFINRNRLSELSIKAENLLLEKKHNSGCNCEECFGYKEFLAEVYNFYTFPFLKDGKIDEVYPIEFIRFVENTKFSNQKEKIIFKVEGQEFEILDNLQGVPYPLLLDNSYNVASVSDLANEFIKNVLNQEEHHNHTLLPFAKEINGYDNNGYLFFLYYENNIKTENIYYYNMDDSENGMVIVESNFQNLLENKKWTVKGVLERREFINEFLQNHKLVFDKNSQHSFCEIEEIQEKQLNLLNCGECHLKLSHIELEGKKFSFTTIFNGFELYFKYNDKNYRINCSVSFDDSLGNYDYQKLYEHYYFYDSKDNPKSIFAILKLKLKMILYSTLLYVKDVVVEKQINLLDVLTDKHLQELEKAFTYPVEIDYYED